MENFTYSLIPLTRSIANWSVTVRRVLVGCKFCLCHLKQPALSSCFLCVSRCFQLFPGVFFMFPGVSRQKGFAAKGGFVASSNAADSSFGFVFDSFAPFAAERSRSEKIKSKLVFFFDLLAFYRKMFHRFFNLILKSLNQIGM